ncbi:MAG: PilW family protein [Nitrospirota bacterium]|nr:PilW family protein [Nitrospirota bacterium]
MKDHLFMQSTQWIGDRDGGGERGTSLVELMFGLAISMIVVAAGYTVMASGQQTAAMNDQTVEMQQNARIAMDLVSQDLRTAGFGMSGQVGACNYAIVPNDNTPAGADTGPDSFSVVVPTNLSTLALTATGTIGTVTLQNGAVAAMTPSGFGNGSIISIGGVYTTTVASYSGDVVTLGTAIPAPKVYVAGTQVYWLQCVTYDIATTTAACSGPAPCLRRGGVPVVEGIEDLQVAYACDGCNGSVPDGVADDQNASNTFDTSDFISNSTWVSSPGTPDTIRLARVSIVARQARSDPNWKGTSPQAVEDHNPTSDAGYNAANYSQIRRRIFTRTIQLRNQGLGT